MSKYMNEVVKRNHAIETITKLWHRLEKMKSDSPGRSGLYAQVQRELLQAAYEEFDLVDSHQPGKGIRLPVLIHISEITVD